MGYVGQITAGGSTHAVASTLYGTCDTPASTTAKVVTCTDFDQLITGVTIKVKFTYDNTAYAPTLNVNSTGAKNIYRFGTTATATWQANSIVLFTYDGSAWIMNDTSTIRSASDYQVDCTTAANVAAKTVTVSGFSAYPYGQKITVNFINGNTASNPTLNVNGTGALKIYSGIQGLMVGDDYYKTVLKGYVTLEYQGPLGWYIVSPTPLNYAGGTLSIPNGGTGATTAEDAVKALDMVFKPGDTINVAEFWTAGYLSNSATGAYIHFPLCKPCVATGVKFTNVTGRLRQGGTYLAGSSTTSVALTINTVTIRDGYLSVIVYVPTTSGISKTNNGEITVEINSGTITFS